MWISPETPRPVVIRPGLTPRKTMLCIAFTGNGKVCAKVTHPGETVDSDWYINFVHQTGEQWRKLRSDPTCLKELLWQHDNARPHTSTATTQFFQNRKIELIHQAPYSPDLNQCDRWLFKHLKKALREKRLDCADDVQKASLNVFREIPEQRFVNELHSLRDHCLAVVAHQGDYITK